MDEENHYRPLPEGLFIEESRIEGQGLFTDRFIHRNTDLGLCHIETMSCPPMLVRTPLGGFINHSDDPNSYIATNKGDRILHTIKPVKAGEEITVYYRFKGYDGIIGDDTEVDIEH